MPIKIPVDLDLTDKTWVLIRRCVVCGGTKRAPQANGQAPKDPICSKCDPAGLEIISFDSDEALQKYVAGRVYMDRSP